MATNPCPCEPKEITEADNLTYNDLLANIYCALNSIACAIIAFTKQRCIDLLDPIPYDAGDIEGDFEFNRDNSLRQKANVVGDVNLLPPTNGREGHILKLSLTAIGADRALTLDSDILIPSDSGITFPKTLDENNLYILMFEYNGTKWMLQTFVGGYAV